MEIRELILRMSRANPLWGAPRIHGELLKLGLTVSQATVSKYMLRQRKPPWQTWRAFLTNHAKELIAVDFFTVPTATFRILFVLGVLSHDRRRLVHFNVTEHPTAGWAARQLVEACGWRRRQGTWSETGTKSMENDFRVRRRRWTSGKLSLRHARPGKTPTPSA
jgi:putative transposase